MGVRLYFSTGKGGVAIQKYSIPIIMKAWIPFFQNRAFMGTLVTSALDRTGNGVIGIHLCFFSTEMEYSVDYTCKQYKQK